MPKVLRVSETGVSIQHDVRHEHDAAGRGAEHLRGGGAARRAAVKRLHAVGDL